MSQIHQEALDTLIPGNHRLLEVTIPVEAASYPANITISPSKHHSQEADELDILCSKLSDVRVRPSTSQSSQKSSNSSLDLIKSLNEDEDDLRLCDVVSFVRNIIRKDA